MQVFRYKDIEYSEVMFSELDNILRVDAEYFQGAYLRLLNVLKKKDCKLAQEFAYITDGIHSSIDFDENSNINLISAKSPKENIFDLTSNSFISLKQHEENSRTELKKGDVILSTVGTIGNCAVVDESVLPANADRHVGIIRIQRLFSPYYLASFLLSKYGRFQTIRESTGNVQLNLFIIKLNKLRIPLLSKSFQITIENLVKEAHQKIRKSKLLYQDAENLLLEELGLKDWQPEDSLYSELMLSESFGATRRLDAEYFQPQVITLIKILQQKKHIRLHQSCNIFNGYAWKSEYFLGYDDEGFEEGEPFVRIRNCKPGSIDIEGLSRLKRDYVNKQNVAKVMSGDIVIGMDGLKWFYASLIVSPCYVNQRVCWLRPHTKASITPEYLMFFINTIAGQNQLLREMTIADTVGHITNQSIGNIVVPLLSEGKMEKITIMIRNSIAIKYESHQLLDLAKQIVERAIETSEEEALSLIEQNGLI